MKKVMLILATLAVACDTPTVPERFLRDIYDFRLRTPQAVVLRWPTGSEVNVFVAADADPARTQYLRDAVTHAARVWNDALLYGEAKVVETSSLETADVVVMYSLATPPVELGGCSPGGGAAYTTFCLTPDAEHLEVFPRVGGGTSRVKFVVSVRTLNTIDAVTVRRLVTHEFGHMLGIAQHSARQTDLMYGGTLNRDDTSPADRATLQVLYHTVADVTP